MEGKIYTLYSEELKNVVLHLWRGEVGDGFSDADRSVRIVSIVDGRGRITHNDGSDSFVAGDVFIFDRSKEFTFTDTEFAEIILLKFNMKDFLREEYRVFKKNDVSTLLAHIENSVEKMRGIHINTKRVLDVIYMIEREFESERGHSTSVIKACVILILSLISQYLLEELAEGGVNRSPYYNDIKRSLDYISENLAERLTLDKLAEIANMGKTSYSIAFKSVTGMTVWDYILNARIEYASNFFIEKNMDFNITEIAMLSGFTSAAHFTKTFKKIKGITPREYKKNPNNPCF